jgi:nucleoid DNA-binding protein
MAKKAAPKAAETKAPEPKAAAPAPKAAKAAKAEKVEKTVARPKAASKGEVISQISDKTKVTKKDVTAIFDALSELIASELGKKGPGVFQIPGLVKLKVKHKPAEKARPGINRFTKEPMTIAAKPARKVVKAAPLKALKELV